jgi:hypothetical protein
VTNNIAVIEQEANEALSENRRELAEESTKINRESQTSPRRPKPATWVRLGNVRRRSTQRERS